jgi:hypothetical protein
MYRIINKLSHSFSKKQENPFKRLVTNLEEAGKGCTYYSLSKMGDPRLGTIYKNQRKITL